MSACVCDWMVPVGDGDGDRGGGGRGARVVLHRGPECYGRGLGVEAMLVALGNIRFG